MVWEIRNPNLVFLNQTHRNSRDVHPLERLKDSAPCFFQLLTINMSWTRIVSLQLLL